MSTRGRKKPTPQIDVTEWVMALAAAEESAADSDVRGVSAEELADAMGCSVKLALRRIRNEIRAGRWELSGQRTSIRIDGRRCHTPVYAPVSDKE